MKKSGKQTWWERLGTPKQEARRPARPPDPLRRGAALKRAKSLMVLPSQPLTPSRQVSLPHLSLNKSSALRGRTGRGLEWETRLAWRGYSAFLANVMRKRKLRLERATAEERDRIRKVQLLLMQVQSLRQILDRDNQKLQAMSKEITQVRRRFKESSEENDRLKQGGKEAQETVYRLRESLEDCKQDLLTCKNSEVRLKSQASDLQLQLVEEKGKSAILMEENASLGQEIVNLKKEFDEKLEKMEELDISVANLKSMVEMQQGAIKCAREQKNQDDLLVKNYVKEVQQLNMEVCLLMKENKLLRSEVARLRQLQTPEAAGTEEERQEDESCVWPETPSVWRLVYRALTTLLHTSGPHPLSYQPPSQTPLHLYLSHRNQFI